MQWLIGFLWALAVNLASWFIERGLAKLAAFFATVAVTLGLFTALLATFYTLLNGIQVVAPFRLNFILSMLPQSTLIYLDVYVTALIAKRVYDFKVITLTKAAELKSVKLPSSI